MCVSWPALFIIVPVKAIWILLGFANLVHLITGSWISDIEEANVWQCIANHIIRLWAYLADNRSNEFIPEYFDFTLAFPCDSFGMIGVTFLKTIWDVFIHVYGSYRTLDTFYKNMAYNVQFHLMNLIVPWNNTNETVSSPGGYQFY